MPGSASLFHMHALFESDYATFNVYYALFCFAPRPKGVKPFFSPNSSEDLRSDAHQSQIFGGMQM